MLFKRASLYKKISGISVLFIVVLLSGCDKLEVLDPQGPVGESQKSLIQYALVFMVGIVLLVFVLFGFMVFKYREKSHRKTGDYKPDMDGNNKLEFVWTLVPILIVTSLAIPTVKTLFELEKPPVSSESEDPLVIYATSADWKWFFSYPEQGIETVNYLHVPTDRPVEFKLTSADAMASLWIPQLGGQKYNMAGMETTLYLQADETGVYRGRNASFTGEGFAAQTFQVHAESKSDFQNWVKTTQDESPEMTEDDYIEMLKPGLLDEKAFASTHLDFVDHAKNEGRDYAVKHHLGLYEKIQGYENDKDWRKKVDK